MRESIAAARLVRATRRRGSSKEDIAKQGFLELIADNPGIRASTASKLLDKEIHYTHRMIGELVAGGLVQPPGPGSWSGYRLTEYGEQRCPPRR